MNNRAAICRTVLDEVSIDFDDLAERLGLSTKIATSIVGALAGEGVLRRNGSYVSIAHEARARVIADSEPQPAVMAQALPTAGAAPAKKRKGVIPDDVLVTAVEIEKGVPIPDRFGPRKPFKCLWPFADMEVGDSFAVPVPAGVEAKDLVARLRRDIGAFDRLHPPFRATTRIADDAKSVRVWRTIVTVKGNKIQTPAQVLANGDSSAHPRTRAASGIRVGGKANKARGLTAKDLL